MTPTGRILPYLDGGHIDLRSLTSPFSDIGVSSFRPGRGPVFVLKCRFSVRSLLFCKPTVTGGVTVVSDRLGHSNRDSWR